MSYGYGVKVTDGAVRIFREWLPEDGEPLGPGTVTGVSTAGRQQVAWSQRSRRAMRYRWSGLPWEMLGRRPALITLTYPGQWRSVCADSRSMAEQREAFRKRWQRAWGPPIGGWVVEFQPRLTRPIEERQAPHHHIYVGLPEEMKDHEFMGLIHRTHKRKAAERQHGKYQGRRITGPPQGDFADWLLRSWSEVLGTHGTSHGKRGADITPCFWSEKAERDMSRGRIGEYFWRESGKWGQKTPPEGFGGLSFYGEWGRQRGFRPVESEGELERAEFYVVRRVLHRVGEDERRKDCEREGRQYVRRGIRGRKGLTAFMVSAREKNPVLLEWARTEAIDGAKARQERASAASERKELWEAWIEPGGPGNRYWDGCIEEMEAGGAGQS